MDKIFLSSLAVECIVGIWEWERRVKQTVIIDIEMAADIRKAAASDHIDDTIDYKRACRSGCRRSWARVAVPTGRGWPLTGRIAQSGRHRIRGEVGEGCG